MANIKDTRSKLHDKIGKGFDIPSEHVESEGERLIKSLSEKQINTKINLSEELSREQQFQKSQFLPITTFMSGQINLDEFQEINDSVTSLEFLYSCDLNNEEVQFYNDSLKGIEFLKIKYKNLEPNVLSKRLNNILEKIKYKRSIQLEVRSRIPKPSQFNELGICVKPDSNETKLYKFALSCNQKDSKDNKIALDHPINNLKQLENDLFPKYNGEIPSLEKRRKRARKILDNSNSNPIQETQIDNVPNKTNSKWDIKEPVPTVKKIKHIYTCEPFNSHLKKNNQFVEKKKAIDKGVEFVASSNCKLIPLDHIKKYRLSLEEIKQIPIFQNYDSGSSNNVLFVKNLSADVTEIDLTEIFENFHQENQIKITYKIMGGKMKGQAFITFPSNRIAEIALKEINGYLLKGKPMIIQYGRGVGRGKLN